MIIIPNNNEVNRNHTLDVIKGVCIIIIIITHFRWETDFRLKYGFPFWIDMAVPIFMIISGYTYSMSYARRGIKDFHDSYSPAVILSRLLAYTFPFLIIFIIENVIFICRGGNVSLPYIIMLFFEGGYSGAGSYYYPLLIQLIFVFPIIYFIIKRLKSVGLMLIFFSVLMLEYLKIPFEISEHTYRLLIYRYLFLIANGSYLFLHGHISKRVSVLFLLIGTIYIYLTMYKGFVPPVTYFWTGTSLWASLFIIPIMNYIMLRELRAKLIELIGKCSYEIFFVQVVFYLFFYEGFSLLFKEYPLTLRLFICIITIVFTGIVLHYFDVLAIGWINDRMQGSKWCQYIQTKWNEV